MRGLSKRSTLILFAAIYLLVLAQVGWWAFTFIQNVELISQLRLSQVLPNTQQSQQILAEAFHKKAMFFSESLFFAVVACLGLAVLYRALRAERKSREIQRNFIEIVSHESKTPLTGLKLRLESLRDQTQDAAMQKSLASALDEVRRLSGVLEKTLELNRSERHALHFEAVSLAEVVESVIHRLDPWIAAKEAKLDVSLDSQLFVRGDFASLQNSVQSLLENALQYNPRPDKQIQIRLFSRGARVILAVSDNGPGIAPREQARIFDRFYRGQSAQGVSGTGLGLYLARVILEAHRGGLHLVSSLSGACFEMDLPQARHV